MATFDKVDVKKLEDVAKLQDNLVIAFKRIGERPMADAVLVEGIVLGTSNVAVRHGLSGPVRGWIVVKGNAGVIPYTDTVHATPTEFIYLKAPATITVSLLFF